MQTRIPNAPLLGCVANTISLSCSSFKSRYGAYSSLTFAMNESTASLATSEIVQPPHPAPVRRVKNLEIALIVGPEDKCTSQPTSVSPGPSCNRRQLVQLAAGTFEQIAAALLRLVHQRAQRLKGTFLERSVSGWRRRGRGGEAKRAKVEHSQSFAQHMFRAFVQLEVSRLD